MCPPIRVGRRRKGELTKMSDATDRPWRLLPSLQGYQLSWLPGDGAAALTLAAIAIPEQIATARLVGLPPLTGLIAFAAGTLVFAAIGKSRVMSVGADSTIAPIIGGALATIAATGQTGLSGLAGLLAGMVGLLLILSRVLRLGWIADLLSVPVTTGILIGIAGHIVVGQMPSVLGIDALPGTLLEQTRALAVRLSAAQLFPMIVSAGVLAVCVIAQRIDERLPGPLIGLVASAVAVWWWGLDAKGVATLGDIDLATFHLELSVPAWSDVTALFPVALIVAALCMMQTATVVQGLGAAADPGLTKDFAAVGLGSIAAGLAGAFPVNSSPPRTAVALAAGARSQLSGILAVAACGAALAFADGLLAKIPNAALAGTLIFIAGRLVRPPLIRRIFRSSPVEGLLATVSAALVILLPIEVGIGLSIVLSILHSLYTIARPNCHELKRIPGTTIWWADSPRRTGERLPNVLVFSLGAPINFMNSRVMLEQLDATLAARADCRLLVLEANGVVGVDFSGADLFISKIRKLQEKGVQIAMARLGSVSASVAAERTGLVDAIGPQHIFQSVNEAVRALQPSIAPTASGQIANL